MRRFARRILATCALSLAAVAVGCGGGSDEDQIRSQVETFFSAIADEDGSAGCEASSENLRGDFEQADVQFQDCERGFEAFARVRPPAGDFDSASVDRVTVDGDEATAGLDGTPITIEVVREDGEWLVDDLD